MAFEKINSMYYMADTKEDLVNITAKRMGVECYIIKEACEYKLMSTGEWVKQTPNASSAANGNVDLTGYATEEYVNEKVAAIEIPEVEGLASKEFVEAAIKSATHMEEDYGEEHMFGLMVDSSEGKSLIEAMLEKGKGMYNFHIEKGSSGLPKEVIEKNSSCRGICCVDTYRSDTNWYGWIVMFDHDGEMYSQYIRNAAPTGWKKISVSALSEEEILEITN